MAITYRFGTPGWIILSGLLILGLSAAQAGAAEKDYPNKMITLINPYAPGGGIDFAYRAIVDILPDYLGQKIVVSHKPGAMGRSGAPPRPRPSPTGTPCSPGPPPM